MALPLGLIGLTGIIVAGGWLWLWLLLTASVVVTVEVALLVMLRLSWATAADEDGSDSVVTSSDEPVESLLFDAGAGDVDVDEDLLLIDAACPTTSFGGVLGSGC